MEFRKINEDVAFARNTESGRKYVFTYFVAQRGWPKLMLSDNGNDFFGAAREINEDCIDQEKN